MDPLLKIISTSKGGIFLLLPLVIIAVLFEKAMVTVKPIAETLREKVPIEFPFFRFDYFTFDHPVQLFFGWLGGQQRSWKSDSPLVGK